MALQVWLPLNGDLKNKGCADVVITNNGAVIDNDGKIGKCYNFVEKSMTFPTPLNKTLYNFSVAGWVNLNQGYTLNNGFHIISFNQAYGRICISKDRAAVRVLLNNGNNIAVSSVSPDSFVTCGVWHHYAVTFNNGTVCIYIDGELNAKHVTNVNYITYSVDNLTIGTYSGEKCNGKLNDFRLYDHCLSAKEVKEIAQGLILHYKLNSDNINGVQFHEYLEKSSAAGTKDYIDTGVAGFTINNIRCVCKVSINDTRDSAFFGSRGSYYVFYKLGDNYFWPQSKAETSFNTLSINTNYIVDYNKGHFTVTDESGTLYQEAYRSGTTVQSGNLYIFNFNPTDSRTSQSKIYYFKIYIDDVLVRDFLPCNYLGEPGFWDLVENKFYGNVTEGTFTLGPISNTTICDSSGYGNHGTITGNLTISNDTPRYNYCSNLVNSYISTPMYHFPELTISFWINRNSLTGTRQFIYTGWNGISIEFTTSNAWQIYYTYNSSANTVSCSPSRKLEANIWYHTVLVIGKSGVKTYINGICEKTATYIEPYYNTNTAYIGRFSSNINFNAKLSDFRIYATPLSENDVLQLYQVGASIDNLGNVHSYEIDETSTSKTKLHKTGIFETGELIEGNTKATIEKDVDMNINEFIET